MLDLNDAKDARTYVRNWIIRGDLRLGTLEFPIRMEDGTDQDFLRVAYQLFLYCDESASPPPINPGEYH